MINIDVVNLESATACTHLEDGNEENCANLRKTGKFETNEEKLRDFVQLVTRVHVVVMVHINNRSATNLKICWLGWSFTGPWSFCFF